MPTQPASFVLLSPCPDRADISTDPIASRSRSHALSRIPRADYAAMFGPTTGDTVRLADTDLVIKVERDFTSYGEEVKFGGGKVIRDGDGPEPAHPRRGRPSIR